MLRGAVASLIIVLPFAARAVQYEVDVDVDSEDDLQELYSRGEISEDTYQTLVELLRDGVDLNRATRDELYALPNVTLGQVEALLLYRKQVGQLLDPGDLVRAGVLTAVQLTQLAPFLIVEPLTPRLVSGSARIRSSYASADRHAPPAALQLTAKAPHDLSGAIALVGTRQQLDRVTYDPLRDALAAGAPGYQLHVPKYFVRWKTPKRQVVLGSFRAGFGERLTLDNTTREAPHGFYPDDIVFRDLATLSRFCRQSEGDTGTAGCSDEERSLYVTSDYDWIERFRGLSGSVEDLELRGSARLSLHGFGSYQSRSVYQYALYDRSRCDDPTADGDPACAAPRVYLRQDDPSAPTTRFSYMTLPGVFDELAGGGNATLKLGPDLRFGLTGYWAAPLWRVPGADLSFQEWARYPFGGPFGAVGLDASTQLGPINAGIEATRSFDSVPGGGGGFGVVQRNTASGKRQELEVSFRYFDRGFLNPYARPISAPDSFDGQRARNEAGARARYLGRPTEDWSARASVDFWMLPQDGDSSGTAGLANLYASARADFVGFRSVKVGGWADYRNKDLGRGGRGSCYEISTEENELGEPVPCSGEFLRLAGRVRLEPFGDRAVLTVQYSHELVDDPRYPDSLRPDARAMVELSSRPVRSFRLKARARYLHEAIDQADYLERSLWTYAEVAYTPSRELSARVRYDVYAWLDERSSTASRVPSPEHRIHLDLVTRF